VQGQDVPVAVVDVSHLTEPPDLWTERLPAKGPMSHRESRFECQDGVAVERDNVSDIAPGQRFHFRDTNVIALSRSRPSRSGMSRPRWRR
jgi:hypothetical protein